MASFLKTFLLASCYLPLLVSTTVLEARAAEAKDKCAKRSPIISKLIACSTATPFCASYLGYTGAPPTFTSKTITTTTSTVVKTAISRVTFTSAIGPQVTSGVTTVIAPTSTTTVTVTSSGRCTGLLQVTPEYDYYYGGDRVAVATTKPIESCGLRNAEIGAVSTGCSCFLDPTVTSTSVKVLKTITTTTSSVTKTTVIKGTVTVPSSTVITTPVTTTTTTVSVTSASLCPTPDTSCLNFGLEWAYFPAATDSSNLTDPANLYAPNFEPALTKIVLPSYDGTTGEIGGFDTGGYDSDPWDVYGEYLPDMYTLLDHRGYFFAPQDGTYTFVFEYVDDIAFVWLGPLAYSGWDNSNWDYYNAYPNVGTAVYPTLVGGTYYPFRFFFAQGFGPGGLSFYILAPDGTYIAGSMATPSAYFVQYACDDISGPAYPKWGTEK